MEKFKDPNPSEAPEQIEKVGGEQETPAGEAPAQPAPESSREDSASSNRSLEQEKQELYDRLLRKQAELDNFRKRVQREKEDFLRHATSDLIRALLPVLDGFERALEHRDSSPPAQFQEGVELIYREMMETLTRAGVKAVETKGKIFDPRLHQAVEAVEAPGFQDQEIVEELQRGYQLKDRLLRPAIVRVAVAGKKHGTEVPPKP